MLSRDLRTTSQHYDIEGFKRGRQLCYQYAKSREPLVQVKLGFTAWFFFSINFFIFFFTQFLVFFQLWTEFVPVINTLLNAAWLYLEDGFFFLHTFIGFTTYWTGLFYCLLLIGFTYLKFQNSKISEDHEL